MPLPGDLLPAELGSEGEGAVEMVLDPLHSGLLIPAERDGGDGDSDGEIVLDPFRPGLYTDKSTRDLMITEANATRAEKGLSPLILSTDSSHMISINPYDHVRSAHQHAERSFGKAITIRAPGEPYNTTPIPRGHPELWSQKRMSRFLSCSLCLDFEELYQHLCSDYTKACRTEFERSYTRNAKFLALVRKEDLTVSACEENVRNWTDEELCQHLYNVTDQLGECTQATDSWGKYVEYHNNWIAGQ